MELLTDKIPKLFRKFLVPSLVSSATLSIFGLMDMLVIGQGVGAEAKKGKLSNSKAGINNLLVINCIIEKRPEAIFKTASEIKAQTLWRTRHEKI